MENRKLYVGNLSYSVSEERLRDLFSEYGSVKSVNIITDRETGRSKGFGFIEMSSPPEVREAVQSLNSKELEGRRMKVNEAHPKKDRGSRSGRGYSNRY